MDKVFETYSPLETFNIGYNIGQALMPGDIICLEGDLGTGKTVFSQGLGVLEAVNSPTFTIVQVYEEARLPFYHFDVYRISDIDEMDEIGYEDYFFGNGVCLIEWASLIKEIIPRSAKYVYIEKDVEKGFDYRKVTIKDDNTSN